MLECDIVGACHDKAVDVGDLLGVRVSDEELHFSDGGSEIPWIDVVPVGALQGVWSGGLRRGVDWGSCYYAGPLETVIGHSIVAGNISC